MIEEYKKVWFEAWQLAMRQEEGMADSITIADECLKAYRKRFELNHVQSDLPSTNMGEQVIKT